MGPKTVRRLVSGHDAAGRSCFLQDAAAPTVLVMAAMGGLALTDLWETHAAPADNTGSADNADRPVHLEPDARGTIFRIVDFPPDAAWKDGADVEAAFNTIGAGHTADLDGGEPGMHKTASIDYALVIEGEIWAVLESDERLMRAGDVLVQRGTNHAWANRTDSVCRVMFVLVGATPL